MVVVGSRRSSTEFRHRVCRKVCCCIARKASGMCRFDLLLEERVIDILGLELVYKSSELSSLFISMCHVIFHFDLWAVSWLQCLQLQ